MTISLAYAWTENFVLALSHDEVVHGKGSIFSRMPGGEWQKFANLRAYYAFMWAHPGKKLMFMGGEFGQRGEWDCAASLDWSALDDQRHRGVQALIRQLNAHYRGRAALHELDCDPAGFAWIQAQARAESVFAFLRYGHDRSRPILAVFNFTPVVRKGYRIGVPSNGEWRVFLDTDDTAYGGSGALQHHRHEAAPIAHDGQPFSIIIDLPPLAGLYLALDA
jgi:1,4-alpha-glucan branching enzyme